MKMRIPVMVAPPRPVAVAIRRLHAAPNPEPSPRPWMVTVAGGFTHIVDRDGTKVLTMASSSTFQAGVDAELICEFVNGLR